jgi:hypothetical protein
VNDPEGTTFTFQVSSRWQVAAVKKALKVAKAKLKKGEKTNSAALVMITKHFLQTFK